MDIREFTERIFMHLPYVPNDQQTQLIAALAKFCSEDMPSDSVFMLCGYAGTGKTSLTGALVRALRDAMVPVVLMAPTDVQPRFCQPWPQELPPQFIAGYTVRQKAGFCSVMGKWLTIRFRMRCLLSTKHP